MLRFLRASQKKVQPHSSSTHQLHQVRHDATKGLENAKRTPLYDFHVHHKASFMPFAGWAMPSVYQTHESISAEHIHCREACGLFDVSHMRQLSFRGKDRERFIEWVTPADVQALPANKSRLTALVNEKACPKDDCIVSRHEDRIGMVVNADPAANDIAHLEKMIKDFKGNVAMEVHDQQALIALQGPKAAEVLGPYVPDLKKLFFMHSMSAVVKGFNIHIARSGYTGEDGFEISVHNCDVADFCHFLCEHEAVWPVGLGCRNTLRLESGMCLYGTDISESTPLYEAGLEWTISPRRKQDGGFIGYDEIKRYINDPKSVDRKRIGIKVLQRGPCPRGDGKSSLKIHPDDIDASAADAEELKKKVIGVVTSGCPSPTLKANIAMAYVDAAHATPGKKLKVSVGRNELDCEVVKLPFVRSNLYTPMRAKQLEEEAAAKAAAAAVPPS